MLKIGFQRRERVLCLGLHDDYDFQTLDKSRSKLSLAGKCFGDDPNLIN